MAGGRARRLRAGGSGDETGGKGGGGVARAEAAVRAAAADKVAATVSPHSRVVLLAEAPTFLDSWASFFFVTFPVSLTSNT